ncbi:flagellin [Allorhizobium pseudoryzae]|uniref:flagellin N-terminal helical domain-containing protein n=1 Tax=Allorhizobium pseudoryzae TaxID=379684 RepID=UPI003CFEE889
MSTTSVNSTAASALALLGGTTRALSENTTRVASGREVQSASDNAAYWSIATTMKSSNLSLSSAEDAQAFSAAIADTAALGMAEAGDIMSEIQSKLILAKTPGIDKDALNSEISQLKEQLGTVIDSSSFNGQNWLKTSATKNPKMESMVGSVTSNARGDVSVNVINFDRATSNLVAEGDASDGLLTRSYSGITRSGAAYDYYLLDAGSTTPAGGSAREIGLSSSTTDDEIDGMISAMNSMMKGMTDGAATIGATSKRIDSNADFLATLQDVTEIGIGSMVDANLEEEAARRASLVVQQQLQTVGLNITNASMAGGLKIFA